MLKKRIINYAVLVNLLFLGSTYPEKLVVADFDQMPIDAFPEEWGVKRFFGYRSGENNPAWKVRKDEEGGQYLEANSNDDSYTVGTKFEYDPNTYKFLSWRWRVRSLPEGGDERNKKTGDSGAGVYVVFPGFIIPHTIKYVWSTTLPVGTVTKSPYTGRTKVLVIRSGEEGLNEWIPEKRNVYEDYLRLFKKSKADKKVRGIALLTDSDNVSKTAAADYDDFEISIE